MWLEMRLPWQPYEGGGLYLAGGCIWANNWCQKSAFSIRAPGWLYTEKYGTWNFFSCFWHNLASSPRHLHFIYCKSNTWYATGALVVATGHTPFANETLFAIRVGSDVDLSPPPVNTAFVNIERTSAKRKLRMIVGIHIVRVSCCGCYVTSSYFRFSSPALRHLILIMASDRLVRAYSASWKAAATTFLRLQLKGLNCLWRRLQNELAPWSKPDSI